MLELPLELIVPTLQNSVPSALSTINSFESISNSVFQFKDTTCLELTAEKPFNFTGWGAPAGPYIVCVLLHMFEPQDPS